MTTPSHVSAARHDPYAALRSRNYRRYATGWTFSVFGLQMQGVAVGWEVYHRTGSALDLGYVGLAQAIPVVLLALVGGHAADTHDRRLIVFLTQLVYAVCAFGQALVAYEQASMTWVYVLLAVAASAKAFNSPARQSLLPLLVDRGVFENVVNWNSGIFQLCATLGPALGGILIGRFGGSWPVFVITGTGALVFACFLGFVKPRPQGTVAEPRSWKTLAAGLGYLKKEKTILGALTLDLLAVLFGGATALLPIFATEILGGGSEELGILRAAPFLGAFIMSIVLAHRPSFRRAGPVLLWSVAGFGLTIIGFGLSRNFFLSLGLLALGGALDTVSVVIRHVLVQVRTPEALRGRVAAVNAVFIESSNELGGFESGLVAQLLGPVLSVVTGGVGTLLVVAGVAAAWPQLRRLGTLHEPPPQRGPEASPPLKS